MPLNRSSDGEWLSSRLAGLKCDLPLRSIVSKRAAIYKLHLCVAFTRNGQNPIDARKTTFTLQRNRHDKRSVNYSSERRRMSLR